MPLRIERCALALIACVIAFSACSHPGSRGGTPGTAGNVATTGAAGATGSGGDGATAGNVGTSGAAGNVGTPGSGGNVGDPGTAGNDGSTGGAGAGGASASGVGGSGAVGGNTGSGGAGPTGDNLIANGDFSNGATNWHTQDGTGNVNGSGAYCVSNPGAALIGWEGTPGSLLMLRMGASYRLSYQASGSGTVNVKIGLAVAPYTADFEGSNSLNSSLQTFTHTFTCPNNDINTGLAFTFSNAGSSTVCVDNVTLTAN